MNKKARGNRTQISQAVNHCIPQHKVQNRLAVGVLALGLALSITNPVNADTFTVSNTNDSGQGSFRQAILDANANTGKDTINLSSMSGDIETTSILPTVEGQVDIIGPGADLLSITTPKLDTRYLNGLVRGLTINAPIEIYYSSATFRDIEARGIIAKRYQRSFLEFQDCVISDGVGMNISDTSVVASNLTIKNNTIGVTGFSLRGYTPGIEIFTCDNCLITNNDSHGLAIESDIILTDSIISNNGGSAIISNQDVIIERSTITGNNSGVSLDTEYYYHWNYGTHVRPGSLSIRNSLVSDNNEIGLLIYEGVNGSISNTTISGNGSFGVFNLGYITIDSSTVTKNNGGIENNAPVDLSKIPYRNILNGLPLSSFVAKNSVIAENSNSSNADISGEIPIFVNHSLIQNIGNSIYEDVIPGSNLIGINPFIGPLADNGGSTQTHALLPGSPAIDAGDPANCPTIDQRGITRPQGAGCDIGAYEVKDNTSPFAICDLPPISVGGNCAEEVVVRSMTDLDAYIASNFGKTLNPEGKPVYKNLRLVGEIGQAGTPLDVSVPCRITVNAATSLTGSDITLHSRQGVTVNWSADINASGEACLISDKQHALLNGGNVVNANTLAIRGAKKAIVGFKSTLMVNDSAELISTGTGVGSQAKIANKTTLAAGSFTMAADNTAELAFEAGITTTGELSITSGNLTASETLLTNRSSVQSGTDLTLNSGGKTRIGFHTTVTAGNNLDVNASTEAECSVASITSTTYSSKSGNCSSKLP